MAERIVLVAVFAAVIVAAVMVVRRLNARRVAGLQAVGPDWSALGAQPDGRRTLIAFSTPSCAACHQAQAPAIEVAFKQLVDEVRLIRVDAARQPEAARAFGILTVPSTVVLDADGEHIVAVNQGFAPSATLLQQLRQAAA
jgi:hypothetical protein